MDGLVFRCFKCSISLFLNVTYCRAQESRWMDSFVFRCFKCTILPSTGEQMHGWFSISLSVVFYWLCNNGKVDGWTIWYFVIL